jgi:hypothetical protein
LEQVFNGLFEDGPTADNGRNDTYDAYLRERLPDPKPDRENGNPDKRNSGGVAQARGVIVVLMLVVVIVIKVWMVSTIGVIVMLLA